MGWPARNSPAGRARRFLKAVLRELPNPPQYDDNLAMTETDLGR
ncbi:MAG: hypothetical protein R3D29_00935 [Nitratireductor sp.]